MVMGLAVLPETITTRAHSVGRISVRTPRHIVPLHLPLHFVALDFSSPSSGRRLPLGREISAALFRLMTR